MTNNKKMILKLTAILMVTLCVVLVFASPLDYTKKVSALTDSKAQGMEERIEQLKKDQEAYEQKMKEAQAKAENYLAEKEILDKQIGNLNDQIRVSNDLIIQYTNDIAAKEGEIEQKQTELDTKFENFKERLRVSYEDGAMGYIAMLFSSESISDFFTSMERMTNMLDYDRRMMEQINDAKSELSNEKNELEQTKASQQTVYDDLTKAEQELEQKSKEAEDYYKEETNSAADFKKKMEAAQKQEKEEAAKLDEYLKELANKNNGVYTGGAFSWPLSMNQNKITSKFGWRILWGVNDYHRGIDISVPTGTPIYACADGDVNLAGWGGSYGYHVVISHGSGYTTLYAHASSLAVKAGQSVKRGDVIAYAGSTGNSSGPHLHLEIAINAVLQDPLANGILSHPNLVYYC